MGLALWTSRGRGDEQRRIRMTTKILSQGLNQCVPNHEAILAGCSLARATLEEAGLRLRERDRHCAAFARPFPVLPLRRCFVLAPEQGVECVVRRSRALDRWRQLRLS